MSMVPRIAAPLYPVSRTSGAGTFDCADTTKARTQVSLAGTSRSRVSVGPCERTCANSTPATVATQPAPTTRLPPATDGCDADSSVIAPQARLAGRGEDQLGRCLGDDRCRGRPDPHGGDLGESGAGHRHGIPRGRHAIDGVRVDSNCRNHLQRESPTAPRRRHRRARGTRRWPPHRAPRRSVASCPCAPRSSRSPRWQTRARSPDQGSFRSPSASGRSRSWPARTN